MQVPPAYFRGDVWFLDICDSVPPQLHLQLIRSPLLGCPLLSVLL